MSTTHGVKRTGLSKGLSSIRNWTNSSDFPMSGNGSSSMKLYNVNVIEDIRNPGTGLIKDIGI